MSHPVKTYGLNREILLQFVVLSYMFENDEPAILDASKSFTELIEENFEMHQIAPSKFEELKKTALETYDPVGHELEIGDLLGDLLNDSSTAFCLSPKDRLIGIPQGISLIMKFDSCYYLMSNATDLDDLYFSVMGRYFGYPECCIESFKLDYLDHSRVFSRTKRDTAGSPHITCDKCHDTKTGEQLLKETMMRRVCSTDHNAMNDRMNENIHYAEILSGLHTGILLHPWMEAIPNDAATPSTNLTKQHEEAWSEHNKGDLDE